MTKGKMRLKIIYILILILVITSSLFLLPKHVLRYFYWNYADLNDYQKFPSVPVKKGETTFYFAEGNSKASFEIPEKYLRGKTIQVLKVLLKKTKQWHFLSSEMIH